MILDKQNEFSTAQAVTTTAVSTNVIDLGSTGRTIGNIEYRALVLSAVTAFEAAGAGTLTAQLVTSDNDDLSSPTVLSSTGPLSLDDLDGTETAAIIDLPDTDYKRYLGLNYVVGTGPFTAGAITAGLVMDAGKYRSKARGYVIQ